jgi:hypothetical protein
LRIEEAAVALSGDELRVELRRAGIANAAVDAVWPLWWSNEAEGSLSATAELTFTVARRLGLAPQALLGGEARFEWRDQTKFKHLSTQASPEEAALASFGFAVARALLRGHSGVGLRTFTALEMRDSILAQSRAVDAENLLLVAWGLGIPVVHLEVFPLPQKRMHAMSIGLRDRAVVLLAQRRSYTAPLAFDLAHELGHVMLGHLNNGAAIVDFDDPLVAPELDDDEERAADRFALELLTGQPEPRVETSIAEFNATQLAAAVLDRAPDLGIDPGVLAMCAGYTTGRWNRAYGALKMIPPGVQDVASSVNALARRELDWSALGPDRQDYLLAILGLANDGQ